MPLFRRSPEPQRTPVLTINGNPQPQPEAPGVIQRRSRMFIECERRLADDPLAAPDAIGRPLGDGQGLENLVAKIRPLFSREPSLIRWVALRGALAEIFIWVFDPESTALSRTDLEATMGLEWTQGPDGEQHPDLAEPWRSDLSPEHRELALGIASSVLIRAEDYPRYSNMSVNDVNADPVGQRMSRALALDVIAWSAIAFLRLGWAQQRFEQVPEPDALANPGWHTEPLFAKSERYWDGSDWTERCRVLDGRRYIEVSAPLG